MKNNLCMGTFMRVNRTNFLICLVIVTINTIIAGIGVGVAGDAGIGALDTIKNALLSISIMFVPLYVFMCVLMNAILTVPKGILLSTPRKKLYKTMVANDIINILGAMVIVVIINLLVYGKLQLNGVSTDVMSNLKLVGFVILLGLVVANLVEYICFMFTAFNVYYGLANIFALVGIIFYFARDVYFMVLNGNITFLFIISILGLILLLYVNHILVNRLEVRG